MRKRTAIATLLAVLLPAACGGPASAPVVGASPGAPAAAAPGPASPATSAPASPAPPGAASPPAPAPTASASTMPPRPSVAPPAPPTPGGPLQFLDLPAGAAETRLAPGGRDLTAVLVRAGAGAAPGRLAIDAPPAARRVLAAHGDGTRCPIAPPAGTAGARTLLQARELGPTEDFWVNTGGFDAAGDRLRRCRRVGARDGVALYADLEAAASEADLAALLDVLADETRPRLERAFGPLAGPWSGGGTLVLVVSPAVGDFGARAGEVGYFWSRDLLPDQPNANRAAAVFVSDDLLRRPAVVRRAVLGHEAAHLLVFARKSAAAGRPTFEEPWLSEGLATLATDLVGAGMAEGNPHPAVDLAAFQADPEAEGLMEWGGPPAASYGRVYTFARYLHDRFGAEVPRAIAGSAATGRAAVEAALAPHGQPFEAVVRDWALALFFAGDAFAAAEPWRWRGPALEGAVQRATMPGFAPRGATSGAISPRPWGIVARRGAGPGPWRIEIGAPADDRLVGALAARGK